MDKIGLSSVHAIGMDLPREETRAAIDVAGDSGLVGSHAARPARLPMMTRATLHGSTKNTPMCRATMTFLLLGALSLAPACSSSKTAGSEKSDAKAATVECVSYERELRACLAAVGAPVAPADAFAAALSQRDEAARLRLESECARNRVSLRATCK
jgi:hypothetical protein